ncbi:MAG: hypothetical protein IJL09_02280 [Lachnospiraceae bacterium]|nr:hypothetical protein [Lachnospiraceae bacterium]
MSRIAVYIILLIVVAIIITVISIIAYNKRLDRITKGEVRDAHSNVPEPQATAGFTYKAVLIVLSIIALLTISRVNGMIDGLNHTINNLQSQLHLMSMDMLELKESVEQSDNLVSNLSYEIAGEDMEKKTVDLNFSLNLKQYSENTKVTIILGDHEAQLKKTTPGTFSGKITVDLFGFYDQLKVSIAEDNITKVESSDFQQYLFWNVLPMPRLECNLESKESRGKIKCNGWYSLAFDNPEKIECAFIFYVVDGKELEAFNATTEIKNGTKISLDKDTTVTSSLAVRVDILTTDGYRISTQHVLAYTASPEYVDDDYERIFDSTGTLVWDNEKYEIYH